MHITPFEIYLVMQADNFIQTTGTLMYILAGISVLFFCVAETNQEDKFRGLSVFVLALAVCLFGLRAMLPSTKTLATMYAMPVVLESRTLQNLDTQTNRLLEALVQLAEGKKI